MRLQLIADTKKRKEKLLLQERRSAFQH